MSGTQSDLYPCAVFEDRYSGSYSGGRWLAVGEANHLHAGQSRANFILSDDGPNGDDGAAMDFWTSPPDWIAVGDTLQEALDNLIQRVRATPFRRR